MALVAGIDSSTQATKVEIRDADSGSLVSSDLSVSFLAINKSQLVAPMHRHKEPPEHWTQAERVPGPSDTPSRDMQLFYRYRFE